jgi:hypothetical protein
MGVEEIRIHAQAVCEQIGLVAGFEIDVGFRLEQDLVRRQAGAEIEAAGLVAACDARVQVLIGRQLVFQRRVAAPEIIDRCEGMCQRVRGIQIVAQVVIVGRVALGPRAQAPVPALPQRTVQGTEDGGVGGIKMTVRDGE